MSMAQIIKDGRAELGISQRQAAAQVGCARQMWHRWEHGAIPTPEHARRIETLLGLNSEALEQHRPGPRPAWKDHYWPTQKAYDLRSVQWPPNLQAFLETHAR